MKKIIVLLFLSSYLLSTTHLSELLKFNVLIEHYNEHKTKDNTLTIIEFLCVHYAKGDVKDADYSKDMKLPFKTLNPCNHSSITICIPIPEFQFLVIQATHYKIPGYSYAFLFTSKFHSVIWQPPKTC